MKQFLVDMKDFVIILYQKKLSFQFHKKKNSHLQVHIKNIAVQLTFVKNIFYSLLRNVLECFAIE